MVLAAGNQWVIAGGAGTGHLESLVLQDTASGERRSVPADALFVLIGSQPRTQWLRTRVLDATRRLP